MSGTGRPAAGAATNRLLITAAAVAMADKRKRDIGNLVPLQVSDLINSDAG